MPRTKLADELTDSLPAACTVTETDCVVVNVFAPSGSTNKQVAARIPFVSICRPLEVSSRLRSDVLGSCFTPVGVGIVPYMQLVLSSASPRRRELLTLAGFQFVVRSVPVAEVRGADERPTEYSLRLAREKAEASWSGGKEVVLGADTIVVLGEEVLEKPRDRQDAVTMMTTLSGREHQVITGIALKHASGTLTDHCVTRVWFSPLSAREIEEYVDSGEPYDKAGGYGIQGLASKFVERIDGCYFNVMGLPLSLVYRRLREIPV